MTEPLLRRATPDDDEAIAACIGEAFPDNPKARLDVLRWQYRENPFGETASWVWEDDGRVVAHYSAFPVPYLLKGDRTIAGNAVDAAVLPSHQGQKLFTPLAEALYADCAARGWPVVICYASNPIAMRGVARAGVRWMPRLRTSVLGIEPRWMAERFHVPVVAARVLRRFMFKVKRGPVGEEVTHVPEGLDALWAAAIEKGHIRNGIDRGEAWWQWRYLQSPLGPYRIVEYRRDGVLAGAAVVGVREAYGGTFGYLLELMAVDAKAARAVVRTIVRTVEGLSGLVNIAEQSGSWHQLATAGGLPTLPARLEPKGAWHGWVDTTPNNRYAKLVEEAWHVGWGDMDHL